MSPALMSSNGIGGVGMAGIAVIVVTNLILLPVIMSYFGISRSGITHINNKNEVHPVLWEIF